MNKLFYTDWIQAPKTYHMKNHQAFKLYFLALQAFDNFNRDTLLVKHILTSTLQATCSVDIHPFSTPPYTSGHHPTSKHILAVQPYLQFLPFQHLIYIMHHKLPLRRSSCSSVCIASFILFSCSAFCCITMRYSFKIFSSSLRICSIFWACKCFKY